MDDFITFMAIEFRQFTDHENYTAKADCIVGSLDKFHETYNLGAPETFGTGLRQTSQ